MVNIWAITEAIFFELVAVENPLSLAPYWIAFMEPMSSEPSFNLHIHILIIPGPATSHFRSGI